MTSPNPFAPPGPAAPTPVAPTPAASRYSGAPVAPPYPAQTFPAQPYGAQPYGAQPYAAQPAQPYAAQPYPGQPYPPATAYGATPFPGDPHQKPPHLRTGLALGSLFTGLGALVIGLPFTLGVASVAGGLVGLVLGVVALRRVRAGTGGGRAYAWWGVALSAVSSVAGAAVFMATVDEAADAFEEGWNDGWEEGAVGTTDDGGTVADDRARYDVGYEDGYDAGWEDGYIGARYPVPAPGAEDSEIDPADVVQRTFGEQGPVGVYGVTVVDVSLDADDVVLPAFPGNVPADGRYVLATISVTNLGTEPARPAMDLYHYYEGDDELLYGDWSCMSWTPRPLADIGPLAPGETVEYDVCFDVPLDALGRQTVLVDDATAVAYRLTQWSAPGAA